MSPRSERNLDALGNNIESAPQRLYYLRRRRNFLAAPLLRLPTELILKIFAHAIESGDDDQSLSVWDEETSSPPNDDGPTQLLLTAICHHLREVGMASSLLWSTVDLAIPPVAKLFLERCESDPHTIIKPQSASEGVWEQLEGRTFNNLRSIVFEGAPHEFTRRVAGVIRRAPSISNLDLDNIWTADSEFPWPPDDPIPNLSTLRLRNFSISWASPFIRNLRQLTLDFTPPHLPSERTSMETFLTALANCPDLEVLNLAHAGPDLLSGRRDNCDMVVQLRRLRKLSLQFRDPSRVGYILSHIGYPESADVAVYVPADEHTDLSETISQALSHRNAETIQHLHKSTTLTVSLGFEPLFFTDHLFICFQGVRSSYALRLNPSALLRFASKVLEVVGGGAVTSLEIATGNSNPSDKMWEIFLHGLPQLERICYGLEGEGYRDFADPFALVFSRPLKGELVCPQLEHLELPRGVLAQDASATVLKYALAERDVCGRRLWRLGFSDDTAEVGDRFVLEPFLDVADEVQWGPHEGKFTSLTVGRRAPLTGNHTIGTPSSSFSPMPESLAKTR